MFKRTLATLGVVVLASAATGCSAQQIAAWVDWHNTDPAAAEAFAALPEVQQALADSVETNAADIPAVDAASGGWTAGNCASFADEAAAAGVPWGIFSGIAWRESGCNPNVWVVDSDDTGGGLVGFNVKGSLASHWRDLCGATTGNIRGNVPLQMDCIAAQYSQYGMSAWST